MNLIQFLRILAARWAIIAAAVGGCFLTATVIAQLLPERYQATSRIMMDIMKPDPVTGEVMGGQFVRSFASTQVALIKDYRTTGQVIDTLGWANDPTLISRYNAATGGQGYDIRRWYAQQISDSIKADLIEGSNILEISYTADSPDLAKRIVDLIRQSFLTETLNTRRDSARDTANWFDEQTSKALTLLNAAETKRNKFARENGIVLQGDKDSETAKLEAMTGSSAMAQTGGGITIAPMQSQASMQLDVIDAQIAQAAMTLGPNHPTFQALKRQRAVVEANAARSSGGASGPNSAAIQQAYEAQKNRVLGQGEKIDELTKLQRDVELRREQYQKASQRAADLRVQADVGDSGMRPMGDAAASDRPIFPNKPLIIIGSLFLGLALGVVLALLIELFARRVRSDDDLGHASGAPVFAIIGKQRSDRDWRTIVLRMLDRRRAQRAEQYLGA